MKLKYLNKLYDRKATVMNKNLENMHINRIIYHKIYKRKQKDIFINPQFSTGCAILQKDGLDTIRTRIIDAVGSSSHAIEMQICNYGEESACKLLIDYYNSDKSEKDFIEISKRMALYLTMAQNSSRYPGGVLLVVEGTIQNDCRDFIVIMKAESQQAFNIPSSNSGSMDFIQNLILSPTQKLYKLGMFVLKNKQKINKDAFDCIIFDTNTETSRSSGFSEYFYKDFLGLDYKQNSNIQTKDFFFKTKEFINNQLSLKDEDKIKLLTNLHSYVNNNVETTLNCKTFAERYIIDPSMRDNYYKSCESKGLSLTSIHKDLSLLAKKIKTRSVFLDNNIEIKVPSEQFSSLLNIKEDDGNTIITVKGKAIKEK